MEKSKNEYFLLKKIKSMSKTRQVSKIAHENLIESLTVN